MEILRVTRTILSRLLVLSLLYLLYCSYSYWSSYHSDIRFDNLWMTPYFKRIDARRHLMNRFEIQDVCVATGKTGHPPFVTN